LNAASSLTCGASALRALRDYLDMQGLPDVTVRIDDQAPRETRDGKMRQVIALRATRP